MGVEKPRAASGKKYRIVDFFSKLLPQSGGIWLKFDEILNLILSTGYITNKTKRTRIQTYRFNTDFIY